MRPLRRTYRWDDERQEWRDVRLMAASRVRTTAIDPINKGRWYRNFTTRPVWIDSRSALKAACEKYQTVLTG